MNKNLTNQELAKYSEAFHMALGIPFALPKYRRVIPRFDGKHSCTFDVVLSHTPPESSDVGIKRATNSNLYPTG